MIVSLWADRARLSDKLTIVKLIAVNAPADGRLQHAVERGQGLI
jgi:hypothetical protein